MRDKNVESSIEIKTTIESLYLTNTNYIDPSQAINQAESLKSLSTDLYTDAKRFIYELLQNADDSAIEENNVDVVIKLFNDTLVLAHTGKSFSPRDVKGLCSINNGTKKSDTTKTGFKGIGFKSVFGQSNKVTIFSNDEYFKFDASNNFGWKEKWKDEYSESQKKWEQDNERDFLYPWQIIPIYIDLEDRESELDSEVQQFLSTGNWNVATILKVLKKDEIQKAIKELSSNVNMFLFLKKINSIKFEIDTTTIIDIDRNKNELVLKRDTIIEAKWLINNILLTIPSQLKAILQSDANVPKKLKETDSIELTLAIKKGTHGLEKLSQNENLLYAYLPTDEKRYSLPVLVNSTFLTSANRESLHADSKWNQWLFESISLKLFVWISELVKEKYSEQAYDLIPDKLNIKDDDLSKAYDKGIDEAIQSIPFILSKEDTLLKVDEAIMDETFLSEKIFIGSEIINKFIKNKVGEENKIVEFPFITPNTKLKEIGVASFSWRDIPAFFTFENFKSEHTIEKNIQLIEYFKNESVMTNSSLPKDKLKSWSFLYDHKNKLNYPNNIYFPTPDDTTWNSPDSELSFLHKDIQSALIDKQSIRAWLEQLGVIEKTDISFLKKTIIPTASTYVTDENAIETIQNIYNLYKKENINIYLEQLSELQVFTTKNDLLPLSKCYFSDKYNPKFKFETILNENIFLSDEYLVLDDNKDEIKRFFKLIGVHEEISVIPFNGRNHRKVFIENGFSNDYFAHYSNNTYNMQMHTYSNMITLSFLENSNNNSFSRIFWENVITSIEFSKISGKAKGEWGHYGSFEYVENYLQWYIRNNKCLPTTRNTCERSIDVFINTNEIKSMVGKYLPVFDGVEVNQNWNSFFQFKTKLVLNDYLELLTNIMSDRNDEDKINNDNQKRIQLVFKTLLDLSSYWETDETDQVNSWALLSFLADEDNNIISCSELKYYADGDNSIFQNMHPFISLSEENKSHQNIETLLTFFDIEILRQSSFKIEIKGERIESDLKYKLESIYPFLIKWIQKLDNTFDSTILEEKLNYLCIEEAAKLSLSYDGCILKTVKTHLEKDRLLVTTPWSSNTSMLELSKVLCGYFAINGYEGKLGFLLKADDEFEIREYFENENIELPTIEISQESGEIFSEEEEIITLGVTKQEYADIKILLNNYSYISESSIEKKKYILELLKRAKRRVLEHLSSLAEYNCKNVDNSALTVLSGITKYGKDIYIIPRPSDNKKVIIYYPSELDTLEYADSELWYEDGASIPKKLTLGKVLRDTKINKIPIIENENERIIDILHNPKNEEIACEAILPSSLQIAKIIASLSNTNGGYLIIGFSKEAGIVGIHSDFNVIDLTQEAIKYSSHFERIVFKEIEIYGKNLLTVAVEKSTEDIIIENKKYIRIGSMIKEEIKTQNKPLIITEGKTDWKHMKKALERFQQKGLYLNLDIQFEEYEEMNMGDCELDRMVQTYCKTEQSKKHIFIFDRDNNIFLKKYANARFNNHKNNVYSFCIPKISDELDKICIEFYYKEEDLTTEDENGRRIFIGKDFLFNGNSQCGQYITEKRKVEKLDILDRDKKVYLKSDNEWINNIALSKNDFTNNIINEVENFNDFDIEYFKLIFDVTMEIIND